MNAIDLVAQERDRQKSAEGYTAEHDDAHTAGELARFAACYLLPPGLREQNLHSDQTPRFLPFNSECWKPMVGAFTIEGRIRELVKACALGVAEIERLMRPAAKEFHKTVAEKEADAAVEKSSDAN